MSNGQGVVREAFRQILKGSDIPAPASLLQSISSAQAARQAPNAPYSILTNLAHAVFWQDIWLDRLRGKKARSFLEDWKVPAPDEWPVLRTSFLEGIERAAAIAASAPFEHQMKSDEIAIRTLLQIAIHDAYHLGQINLLKRQLRLLGASQKEPT